MKKSLVLAVCVLCFASMSFGQLVTNGNQSIQYIRMLARQAATDIDAVYYNPAGLTQMADGFHLAVHNQTIFQEKKVVNGYPLLNEDTYIGDVEVPVFPSVFAVYKKDKLALSFGFGVNAGGGSADFASGLPSFEIPIAGIPALLTGMGLPTTAYSADIAFNGKSMFLGFQAGASYAVSEMFSVSAGIRYIQATNVYEGSISNIMINPMHPLVNPTGAMLPAPQFFTIIGQAGYAAMTSDASVDVTQKGTAIQPIIGLFFKPTEQLGIGVRYEFNASLELENDTTIDGTGMFPDGEKNSNDIPALLSLGLAYELTPALRANLGGTYYFEKQADMGGAEDFVDSNSYSLDFGLEFDVTEMFLLSAGVEINGISVSDDYQSDFSHELDSQVIGIGGQLKLTQNLDFDFGGIYVNYSDMEKSIPDPMLGSYMEKYSRSTWAVAFGLAYHF